MSARTRQLLVGLLVAAAIGAAAWAWRARGSGLPAAPLAVAPAASSAVAHVSVPALLRSSAWRRLAERQEALRGVRRIEAACGFDPLSQLTDLVVFATGDAPGDLDHVGFVARGDLEHERLAECVRRVVESDGGSVRRVEIDGVPAIAGGRGRSRAAFVGRDAVVGGHEDVVREVIAVGRGDRPGALGDAALARLWDRVSGGDVTVAARVPERWREALRRYLGGEELGDARRSLAGLRGVAVGVDLAGGVQVGAVLEMGDEAEAGRVVEAVRGRIAALLERTMVRLSVAGPVLRRAQSDQDGRDAVLTVRVREEEIDSLIELYEEVRRSDRPGTDAADDGPAPPRAPPSPPEPDEILRPGAE